MRDGQVSGVSTTPLAKVADTGAPIVYGIVQPGPDTTGGVPFVQSRDVGGIIDVSSMQRTSPEIAAKYRRSKIETGDILFSLRGNIGQSSLAPNELDGANIARGIARIRVGKKSDREFVRYVLQGPVLQKLIARNANGSTFRELSIEELRKLPIPDVSLPEQRKIAAILRTWDEALEKLNALRAAKKKVRDATLQTILNNPDWPERPVGELGTVSSAGVDKKSVEGEMPVRLLNFTDVLRRDFLYDTEFMHEVTAQERKVSTCDVRMGDVFFTPSSETRDDIAHSAVAMETMPGVVYSYHVVRLRPTATLDLCFRAYLFKSHHFLRQAYGLAAGSGQRYVLSQDQFREMTVRLPDHATQAKVSAYFATADREIALLDDEIKALTDQKRGLMQKLLTGEWRVEVADDEEAAA